ncbi:MAG: hypothetical protein WC979_06085 [Candidatus Pacearchaeota archaeon]|jgi:hypothetical protein
MIAFFRDYRPIEDLPHRVLLRNLEHDIYESLEEYGQEFEVASLASYQRFTKKAVELVPYFINRGIPVTINLEGDEGLRVISTDAVFPSRFEQPYVEYFIDKKICQYARDISSAYAVIVNATRRNGRFKGVEEKIMASKILHDIDKDGMIDGEFLINPEDLDFARRLIESFR